MQKVGDAGSARTCTAGHGCRWLSSKLKSGTDPRDSQWCPVRARRRPALECLDSTPDKPSPPKFDIGFLTVCRQIYQEAALIPFAANTFSFRDTSDACKFINAIKPEQTQAISSTVYASYLCGTREEAYERLVARGFKRLNTFVVCRIFEENILVDIDPASDDDEESDAGKDEAGERKTAEVEKKKKRKHDQVSDEPEERFKTKRIG